MNPMTNGAVVSPPPVDLAPTAAVLGIGALVAVAVAGWAWYRTRRIPDRVARSAARRRALAGLALWLTFDLVLVGAFTRLTDSGLGCPDWPGCYASASPLGARGAIDAAVAVAPAGPVTPHKAWIEMIHRYLATGVGGLLTVLTATAWWARWRREPMPVSPAWPTLALAWVALQGAFGAWTVTLKLYPLVVTAHLLGGLILLAILAAQVELGRRSPGVPGVSPGLRAGAWLLALASAVQLALGGWVSTNYAVLACTDFPGCQGSLWPAMDLAGGFAPFHELGRLPDGSPLPFAALTTIHVAHRLGAGIVVGGMTWFAAALARGADRSRRRWAGAVIGVAAWQVATGLSNVLLDAPLAAALGHAAGAAVWVLLLTTFLARTRPHARGAVAARAPGVVGRRPPPRVSVSGTS